MEIPFLSITVLISAIIAIVYRQRENVKMYSIFKPLTTVLIIIIALIIFNKTASAYSALMIVALLFSLIGDVFLISKKYFLPGLSSFLLAHICFTIVFRDVANIFVGAGEVVFEFGNQHRSMPGHVTISNRIVLSFANAHELQKKLQELLVEAQKQMQESFAKAQAAQQ